MGSVLGITVYGIYNALDQIGWPFELFLSYGMGKYTLSIVTQHQASLAQATASVYPVMFEPEPLMAYLIDEPYTRVDEPYSRASSQSIKKLRIFTDCDTECFKKKRNSRKPSPAFKLAQYLSEKDANIEIIFHDSSKENPASQGLSVVDINVNFQAVGVPDRHYVMTTSGHHWLENILFGKERWVNAQSYVSFLTDEMLEQFYVLLSGSDNSSKQPYMPVPDFSDQTKNRTVQYDDESHCPYLNLGNSNWLIPNRQDVFGTMAEEIEHYSTSTSEYTPTAMEHYGLVMRVRSPALKDWQKFTQHNYLQGQLKLIGGRIFWAALPYVLELGFRQLSMLYLLEHKRRVEIGVNTAIGKAHQTGQMLNLAQFQAPAPGNGLNIHNPPPDVRPEPHNHNEITGEYPQFITLLRQGIQDKNWRSPKLIQSYKDWLGDLHVRLRIMLPVLREALKQQPPNIESLRSLLKVYGLELVLVPNAGQKEYDKVYPLYPHLPALGRKTNANPAITELLQPLILNSPFSESEFITFFEFVTRQYLSDPTRNIREEPPKTAPLEFPEDKPATTFQRTAAQPPTSLHRPPVPKAVYDRHEDFATKEVLKNEVKRDLDPLKQAMHSLITVWPDCDQCKQKIINLEQAECCGLLRCLSCMKTSNVCRDCNKSPIIYYHDKGQAKLLLKKSKEIASTMSSIEGLKAPQCDQCQKKAFPIFHSYPCNHFFCIEDVATYGNYFLKNSQPPACKVKDCGQPIESIVIDRKQWNNPDINPEAKTVQWRYLYFKNQSPRKE
ncbi:hypothetical protein [Endozoicomonas numazuensis]|nr:hypothetical protein [Endozoicomonas numazuensis]